jgi:hypothetical protein
MDANTTEKFAELLGQCAATGDSRELLKQANVLYPLAAGAGGALAGGAIGYFGTEKEKNKQRNALYGALTGGLSSAGLQLAWPAINFAVESVSSGDKGSDALPPDSPFIPNTVRGAGLGAVGGLGAAEGSGLSKGVGSAFTKLYDRLRGTHSRSGELSAALKPSAIKPLGGRNAVDPARLIQAAIEQNSTNPAVRKLLRTGSFGDPGGAIKTVSGRAIGTVKREATADALDALVKKTFKGKQSLPPDFLSQLDKAYKGPRGRRIAGGVGRYGTNALGAYGGSLIGDFITRLVGNLRTGFPADSGKQE